MNKTILVHAAPGTQVPKEDAPRSYITDDAKGTPVPDTQYYRRLIRDTSLVLVPDTAIKPRKAATAASSAKEA